MNSSGRISRAILIACLFTIAAPCLAQEGVSDSPLSKHLLAPSPVIVKPAKLPSDPGHSFPPELIDKLSQRMRGKSSESTAQNGNGGVLFALPLRKGITNPRPGFFAVSNYVDQDLAAPDSLLDYACGMRTYDLDSGYNHNGVDYFNFPYAWLTMQEDGTAVIAAADGTIIDKHDGEADMSCSLSGNPQANRIVLEHADGSVTIYAHLKRGSTTSKDIGDTVEQGDYLGIIGSSGFSDGPHLHFGVLDSGGNLIEPHQGECNLLNSESWWENQEDYNVTGISFIGTGSAAPDDRPPCPDIEEPFLQDSFSAGDEVFFSFAIRDALVNEQFVIEVFDPSGIPLIRFSDVFDIDQNEAALSGFFSVVFPGSSMSGAYRFKLTHGGATAEHVFYMDSGPDSPPPVVMSNSARNGLYFDPDKDGEGYNFVTTPSGTIIYFYGSDRFGNRLWLISDLIPGEFGPGSTIEVTMFESTGGTFDSPVSSARGLSVWGTLLVEFSACDSAEARLNGEDGAKVSQLIKLAGVAGTGCGAGGQTSDSPWSGLWFALADDGEGYNLIVARNGSILYFYGFKSDGRRLWLISDLIVDELQVGLDVEAVMFESTQGDFDNPVPSSQSLVQWGTATITLIDCSSITIVLTGSDGNKSSATIRLASVIGLDCSE